MPSSTPGERERLEHAVAVDVDRERVARPRTRRRSERRRLGGGSSGRASSADREAAAARRRPAPRILGALRRRPRRTCTARRRRTCPTRPTGRSPMSARPSVSNTPADLAVDAEHDEPRHAAALDRVRRPRSAVSVHGHGPHHERRDRRPPAGALRAHLADHDLAPARRGLGARLGLRATGPGSAAGWSGRTDAARKPSDERRARQRGAARPRSVAIDMHHNLAGSRPGQSVTSLPRAV